MHTELVPCGSCGSQMPADAWSCPNCGDLNPDAEAHEFLYLTNDQANEQPFFQTPMEPGPFSTPMRPWGLNVPSDIDRAYAETMDDRRCIFCVSPD